MSKLVAGRIPAGVACAWAATCPRRDERCPTEDRRRDVDFSCALARLLDLIEVVEQNGARAPAASVRLVEAMSMMRIGTPRGETEERCPLCGGWKGVSVKECADCLDEARLRSATDEEAREVLDAEHERRKGPGGTAVDWRGRAMEVEKALVEERANARAMRRVSLDEVNTAHREAGRARRWSRAWKASAKRYATFVRGVFGTDSAVDIDEEVAFLRGEGPDPAHKECRAEIAKLTADLDTARRACMIEHVAAERDAALAELRAARAVVEAARKAIRDFFFGGNDPTVCTNDVEDALADYDRARKGE